MKRVSVCLVGLALVFGGVAEVRAQFRLYGTGSVNQLYSLDGMTGSAAFLGNTLSGGTSYTGTTYDRVHGILYANDNNGYLYSIDIPTATATRIGPKPNIGGNIRGLAYNADDGFLYAAEAFDNDQEEIFKLDPATGQVIDQKPTDLDIRGLAYDTSSNTLFGISASTVGSLYAIDPQTGGTTLIGSTGFPSVMDIAYAPETGLLYAVSDPWATSGPSTLISIDPATGAGAAITQIDATTVFHLATTPVPEPSTIALLAMGAVALITRAWRKRRGRR